MGKRILHLEKVIGRAIRFRLSGEQPTFAEMLNGVNRYEGIVKGVGATYVVLDGVCQKCKPNHGNFIYLGDDCSFPRKRLYNVTDASKDYELSDASEPTASQ